MEMLFEFHLSDFYKLRNKTKKKQSGKMEEGEGGSIKLLNIV